MLTFCETQESERSRSLLPKSKKIRKHKVEESDETARRVKRKTSFKKASSLKNEESRGAPTVVSELNAQNLLRLPNEIWKTPLELVPSGKLFSEIEPLQKMEMFPSQIQELLKANSLKTSEKMLGKISKLKSPSVSAFPNRLKKMRFLVEAQEQEVQRYLITMQNKVGAKALEQYNSMRNNLKTNLPSRNILKEVPAILNTKTVSSCSEQVLASQEQTVMSPKNVGDLSVEIEENNVDLHVKKNRMSCSSISDEEFCVFSPAKTEASYNDIMSQENNKDEEFDGRKMNIIDRLFMTSANSQYNHGPLSLERKISESLSSSRKRILSSSKVEDITDLLTEVISKSEEEDSLGMEEPNDIWNSREEELCQIDSLSEVQTPLNSFQNVPPTNQYYTPQIPIQYFYNQANNMLNYVKTCDFDSFMLDHDQPTNTTY